MVGGGNSLGGGGDSKGYLIIFIPCPMNAVCYFTRAARVYKGGKISAAAISSHHNTLF